MLVHQRVNSAKLRGPGAGLGLPKHHLLMHWELFLIVFLQVVLQRSLRKQRCLLYFGLQNLSCYIIYVMLYNMIYVYIYMYYIYIICSCTISSGVPNGEKIHHRPDRNSKRLPFQDQHAIQASHGSQHLPISKSNMLILKCWVEILKCLGSFTNLNILKFSDLQETSWLRPPKKANKNMLVFGDPKSPLPDSKDPPKGWTCWRIWAPLLASLGHGIDHGHT